jgi:hypothetical protein
MTSRLQNPTNGVSMTHPKNQPSRSNFGAARLPSWMAAIALMAFSSIPAHAHNPGTRAAPAETAAARDQAAAVTDAAWNDEIPFKLAPGAAIEIKLVMNEGDAATFQWSVEGGTVEYDMHGDAGEARSESYKTGNDTANDAGELTAAFTGEHGWYWRNTSASEVSVTLRVRGTYSEVRPYS